MNDTENHSGRIMPGTKAPDLNLSALGSESFSLHEEASKAGHFLLLLFYRGLHCPICKSQLQDMHKNLDKLNKAGLDLVAISMDSEARARKSRADWSLENLKIAYGLDEQTAREWGLYISTSIKDEEPDVFSEPGLFILKPDGTVFGLTIQSMPFTRPSAEELVKGLSWVVDNEYPARGVA